ncbi:MAG TPA: complex I NDUFA9 subunit family protein [Rubrivivax sp.]|nr:complex I NDUFA9 subunit family protein [Rubrivivax sp.]
MSTARRVLLLGGTGFVGRSLCERLVARGTELRITVATRRAATARAVQFLPNVDPVECDVHDDARLAALVAGHDAVVNLIAILHGSASDFEHVHVRLAQRLAAACAASGVSRVLQVSALGAAGDAPSNYQRSKAAAEAVLRAAPLQLSVLRPSVIFGDGDRFLKLFAQLQSVVPVMPLAAADARFQPVWVEDVSEALVRCLERPETIGQTYECAGPQVFTLAELVRLAGRLSGRERPVWPLPDGLARLQAWAMGLLPGTPLLSRDNLLSMRVPNVAGGELPGLRALGIEPEALTAVAPSYLSPGQGVARLDRWRAVRAGI